METKVNLMVIDTFFSQLFHHESASTCLPSNSYLRKSSRNESLFPIVDRRLITNDYNSWCYYKNCLQNVYYIVYKTLLKRIS